GSFRCRRPARQPGPVPCLAAVRGAGAVERGAGRRPRARRPPGRGRTVHHRPGQRRYLGQPPLPAPRRSPRSPPRRVLGDRTGLGAALLRLRGDGEGRLGLAPPPGTPCRRGLRSPPGGPRGGLLPPVDPGREYPAGTLPPGGRARAAAAGRTHLPP